VLCHRAGGGGSGHCRTRAWESGLVPRSEGRLARQKTGLGLTQREAAGRRSEHTGAMGVRGERADRGVPIALKCPPPMGGQAAGSPAWDIVLQKESLFATVCTNRPDKREQCRSGASTDRPILDEYGPLC
jgi:hypothetical protein